MNSRFTLPRLLVALMLLHMKAKVVQHIPGINNHLTDDIMTPAGEDDIWDIFGSQFMTI